MIFFFQAEDGIRDADVTGVQTCALPICSALARELWRLRRLRRHEHLRQRLTALPEASAGEARATAEALRCALALDDDHPHWQGFVAARQAHHEGRDIALLLDHHLLAPRDREARRLISRMSGEEIGRAHV